MTLWIYDSGANTESIERAVAAAQATFEQYGITAEDAWAAQQKINEGEQVSCQETMRAVAWAAAEDAALQTCCKGWQRIPESAHLELE